MAPDLYSMLATHVAFIVTGYLIVYYVGKYFELLKILTAGYFTHIIAGIFLWNSPLFKVGDARAYTWQGLGYAQNIEGGSNKLLLVSGKDGWPKLLGNLFHLFGYVQELGIYVNALATILAAVFMHLACKKINIDTTIPYAVYLIVFCPASLYWGSLPGREPINWLCIAVMAYATAQLSIRLSIAPILWMTLATFALFPVRGSIALALAGTYIIGLVIAGNADRSHRVLARFVTIAAGALVIPQAINQINNQGLHGRSLAQIRTSLSVANSNFTNPDEVSSGLFSLTTLKSIPRIMLGPLPWEFKPSLFLAIIDAIFWWGLWYIAYTGIRDSKRYDILKLYIVPTFILIITGASALTNYGIVLRLRGLMIPVIAPIIALGLVQRKLRQSNKKRLGFRRIKDKELLEIGATNEQVRL